MAPPKGAVRFDELPDSVRQRVAEITDIGLKSKPAPKRKRKSTADDGAIAALHALRGFSKAEKRKALQRALQILG